MVHKKQLSNTKRIAANKIIDLISSGKLSGAKALISKEFKVDTELYYFFNGWLRQLAGDHIAAIKLFEKSLIKNPINEETLIGLAGSYLEIGDYERAEECASHAVTINSSGAKNLLTLATVISKSAPTNRSVQLEAANLFEQALDTASRDVYNKQLLVDILAGWGGSLLNLNELFQAKKVLETAIIYEPFNTIAHKNLVSVYANTNEIQKALQSAKIAQMSVDKELVVDTCYQEGMLELLIGNYAKGWRLHEYRLQSSKYKYKDLIAKGSTNISSIGKQNSILLFQEQGIGDLLQFLHYIPKVHDICKNIDLVVLPNTFLPMIDNKVQSPKEFIQLNFGQYINKIYIRGIDQIPPSYDCATSLMSLGYWFKTSNTNKPSTHKFITNKQFVGPKRAVGIFWKGSAHHANDSLRSIPTELINKLIADNSDINFISLQIDRDYKLKDASNLIRPKESMEGLLNTLAVINSCDLVISVDSMIAHLAAGANKPVWLMQAFSPDWRWGLTQQDSIWYPSVKNFRQAELQDWDNVLLRINTELNLFKKQID
jgi:tetratricopeptide (TPR) repeat protein